MRIVVLGGNGLLVKALRPHLEGHEVVTASRSGDPSVDLTTGEGLRSVVEGSDVVVHLASNPAKAKDTDIEGTKRILETADTQHLVYMSIVGVDRHSFGYYRAKHAAESLIAESSAPHTIVRATQFHDFVTFLLSKTCRRWAAFIPSGFVFQPIATSEVAEELAHLVVGPPRGLVPDLAGPEVLELDGMARAYMTARAREAPVIRMPVPGKAARDFRNGVHTNPQRAVGRQTFNAYLQELFQG